jgi:hypothetical protein
MDSPVDERFEPEVGDPGLVVANIALPCTHPTLDILFLRPFGMETSRAVAGFTADILEMGGLLDRGESSRLAVSGGMTGKALFEFLWSNGLPLGDHFIGMAFLRKGREGLAFLGMTGATGFRPDIRSDGISPKGGKPQIGDQDNNNQQDGKEQFSWDHWSSEGGGY